MWYDQIGYKLSDFRRNHILVSTALMRLFLDAGRDAALRTFLTQANTVAYIIGQANQVYFNETHPYHTRRQ
jgi:hypothetical protein